MSQSQSLHLTPPFDVSLPSMAEIFAVAARYKGALALSFVLPVAVSILIGLLITPKFESEARLLVHLGREYIPHPETAGSSQSSPTTSMKETVDTEVQILTSMDLLQQVVNQIAVERLYPEYVKAPPSGLSPQRAAMRALAQDLSISPVKLTDVIELRLRNPSPEVAEEALRILINGFQRLHVQAFSSNRSAVLAQQVGDAEMQLAVLQRERAQYQSAHGLYSVAEQRSQLVLQRAKDAEQLRELERHRNALQLQLRSVQAEIARLPATITMQTTSQDSTVADDTQKRLRDLEGRRQELLARGYRADSDTLAGPTAELNSVRRSLARTRPRNVAVTTGVNPVVASLKSQLASLQTELAPLTSTGADLQSAVDTDDARLRALAADDVVLQGHDRRIADLDATTTSLHQRLADARYVEDLDKAQVASIHLVQQPISSDKPVWPNKRLIGAAGVLLGLVTAGFSLLLALTFGNHCLSAATVERLLGAPVLAALGPTPPFRAEDPAATAGLPAEHGGAAS